MNHHRQTRQSIFCAVLVLFSLQAAAFAQGQPDQRPTSPPAAKSRQGFFDYALGKINPEQTDYGSDLSADRELLVAKTLDNVFFWSNVAALFLLAGVTTLHIFNLRAGQKKELIAASLITELWNGRLSDRAEIAKRTEQYNALADKHNATLALAASRAAADSPEEVRPEVRTQRKVERLIDGPKLAGRTETTSSGAPSFKKNTPAQAPFSISDLQQHSLLLERRIEAMQNTEQNLKERLNQTTALLDQERQRNRTLKGA